MRSRLRQVPGRCAQANSSKIGGWADHEVVGNALREDGDASAAKWAAWAASSHRVWQCAQRQAPQRGGDEDLGEQMFGA